MFGCRVPTVKRVTPATEGQPVSLAAAELLPYCQRIGATFEIEPSLLMAFCQVESSCRPFATRYEQHTTRYIQEAYKWARASGITAETEQVHQLTSWGLMQVMGFTARDMGFSGNLPELCLPEVGIEYGARYLKLLQKRFGKAEAVLEFDEKVVASYNAGSPRKGTDGKLVNEGYVHKVWKALQTVTS